jgi:hypothetical protein
MPNSKNAYRSERKRATMDNIIQLRDVDRKRLDRLQEHTETPLANDDIWFIHPVLAQYFLPYRDPKTND